jgi:hypothetical protein
MKYVAIGLAAAVAIVILRAMLIRTISSRLRTESSRAAAAAPMTMRGRIQAILAWPVFFAVVAAVLVLGVFVGSIVGPH